MIVHSRNTTKHSATGFTPFEIIYARKPAASSSLTDETHITSEFVARQLQARQHIEASAKLRMDREKATRRRAYEKTHRVSTEEFKEGDLVLISNEATHSDSTKKLEPKYIGPMRVVQARTQECVVEDKRKRQKAIHKSRMRLYKPARGTVPTPTWRRPSSTRQQQQPKSPPRTPPPYITRYGRTVQPRILH
jgi:hypothetical protein